MSRCDRVALTALALVGLAACTGGGTPNRPDAASDDNGVAVHLQATNDVAPAFRKLGVRTGLRLPTGWSVDRTGVHLSGGYLIFAAFRTNQEIPRDGSASEGEDTDTWIVNASSGRGYRYPPVDRGWYATVVVAAAGWVVRREVHQLPGDQCHPVGDCFEWRLFAQRIGHGTPRLLAQSNSPGAQANAPVLAAGDRTVVWEQSSDGKHYGVYQWTPGAAHAQRRLIRATPGEPGFDGHHLYVVEIPSQPVSQTPTQRVVELIPHGTAFKARTLGTFVGQVHSQVRAGTILHFPRNGAARGRWHLARLTSTSDRAVGTTIDGDYTAVWMTDDQFISWSADGWYLMTTTRPIHSVQIAGVDSGFAIPHTDGQHLALGMTDYHGAAIVGSTTRR